MTAHVRLCALLALWGCVATAGAWSVHQAILKPDQEAFIGWRGEAYMPPPASPAMAAAAEPAYEEPAILSAATGHGSAATDVELLQDIAAVVQPPAEQVLSYEEDETQHAPEVAAAAAASQHKIDVSARCPHCKTDSTTPWIQHLSWHPRLHLHHNFLTPQECDKMRELLARPSHTVGGSGSGSSSSSGSSNIGSSAEDEEAALMLMLNIENRVANWTALPSNHLEGWQLQQGFTGTDTSLHTDLLTDRLATEDYQRFRTATVLLFLGDDSSAANGAGSASSGNWSLVFPVARGGAWRGSAMPQEYHSILVQGKQVEERLKNSRVGRRGSPNEVLQLHVNTHHSLGETSSDGQGFCDGSVQAGLTLTGFKKGSALLIWNQLTDGQTPDASAAHLVCPGNSQGPQPWLATTWLHNMPFGQDSAMGLAASCHDINPACRIWAQQGYCDDAPGVMIGLRGLCRYSCEDCHSCDEYRPTRESSTAAAGPDSPVGTPRPSVKGYMDCLFSNMHSLRQEWSEAARGAGTRKARNAIRRDLRRQSENGLLSAFSAPTKQQSAWAHVW